MVIPRENNLVRLYVQLNEVKTDASKRADRSQITRDVILKAAQRTLAPYKLEYRHCHWWTGKLAFSVEIMITNVSQHTR